MILRDWNREEVAEFLFDNRGLILRRIRGKLRARKLAGGDDTDILSSAARRVDEAWQEGRVRFESEAQFFAYLWALTDNLVSNRLRDSVRRQCVEVHPDDLAVPKSTDARDFADVLMSKVVSPRDAELLRWKIAGLPHG